MGLSTESVRLKGQKLGLTNPTYTRRITKTKHLRESVFKYYMTHSFEQTMEKFNLTRSELKSIFTVGYRDPKLNKYRKDKRTKKAWEFKDTLFLVKHLGLQNRIWIGKKLKRTNISSHHAIKDRLKRLKITSKHFHGLPLEHATRLFNCDLSKYAIQTKAGPTGLKKQFCFKLIPWVTLERLAKSNNLDSFYINAFCAQAKLQRWIYGLKTEKAVRHKIQEIVKER